MSPLELAAERAREIFPSALGDLIADHLIGPVDGGYTPNPSTLQAAEEIMALPVAAEYYVNRDDGYHRLVHEPCGGSVGHVEAGDALDSLTGRAGRHTCLQEGS